MGTKEDTTEVRVRRRGVSHRSTGGRLGLDTEKLNHSGEQVRFQNLDEGSPKIIRYVDKDLVKDTY